MVVDDRSVHQTGRTKMGANVGKNQRDSDVRECEGPVRKKNRRENEIFFI